MRGTWSWAAAAAAAWALACGQSRVVETPSGATSGCASCHTAPGEGPPFRDQTGSTDPGRLTVGAHDAHLAPRDAAPVACEQCHRVPREVSQPGHMDAQPNDVVHFGPLAQTGGANPAWSGSGCSASYCHGNFPGGNTANAPTWLHGAGQASCGSCHGLPPQTGRHQTHFSAGVACTQCHGTFTTAKHVNGVVDVALSAWDPKSQTCAAACHEPKSWTGGGGD